MSTRLRMTRNPKNLLPLPHEIVIDILLQLPFKSVLRCKLASKELKNLVNDSHFSNRYKPKRFTALFLAWNKLYCLVLHEHNKAFVVREIPIGSKYTTAFHHSSSKHQLLNSGSFNGIACVKLAKGPFLCYNMFTGVSSEVVEDAPMQQQSSDSWLLYGFGYDHYADDYKIIVVDKEKKGLLWTTNKGFWKPLQLGFPDYYDEYEFPSSRGCCFNGVLHWVAITREGESGMRIREVIVTYDLHTGRFGEVLPPEDAYDSSWTNMKSYFAHLVEFNGKLCFVTNSMRFNPNDIDDDNCYDDDKAMFKYDVWRMKEYGVGASWEKLLSIDPTGDRKMMNIPWNWMIPTLLDERGDGGKSVLFVCENDYGKMFWYDIKENDMDPVHASTWDVKQLERGNQEFDF